VELLPVARDPPAYLYSVRFAEGVRKGDVGEALAERFGHVEND